MEQQPTDIMIRIRKAGRGGYPVEAWLSDGSSYEGRARFASSWLQDLRACELQPDEYGSRLFRALFDGPIGTAYAVATGQARARSGGCLRIRLMLDEGVPPELHALKWERLSELPGKPLATSGLTPFSRYTALAQADSLPLDDPRVRMLFVISAPGDLGQFGLAEIDVEREVRRLIDALGSVWGSARCQATILPGSTLLSVQTQADLHDVRCEIAGGNATLDNIVTRLEGQHVLHFLGHGQYRNGRGSLALEREDGSLAWVGDGDLALKLGNTPVRLVFLAACESAVRGGGPPAGSVRQKPDFRGLAGRLVQQGVPAVVAMQDQIAIESAYRLTGEFYRRLFLEHGIVDRAVNEARARLYSQKAYDWGTPVLYMRLRTGQLAAPNPVWAALQAMQEDTLYADFATPRYIPLPLQAQVRQASDPIMLEEPEPQQIGSLDLISELRNRLSSSGEAVRGNPVAGPLILVLGGPGTSKSTQLRLLGWKTIQAALQAPSGDPFLPVYLNLQEFQPGDLGNAESLQKLILDALRGFLPGLTATRFDELARTMGQVRLRILVNAGDVLPEVAQDLLQQITLLSRSFPAHQYVVAMQPSSLDWKKVTDADVVSPYILVIQPLTTREIRYFLEAQGDPGRNLLDQLHATSLFDLASTPYFLWKMLLTAQKVQKEQLPTSRASFLQRLIDAAITQVPAEKGMRASTPQTLRKLALEMQQSDAVVWPIEGVLRLMANVRGDRGYSVEDLYAALVKEEILLPLGETSVRFAYGSIQAYFCARAILALPDRDRRLAQIADALGSPVRSRWWEETLVVASGLLAADTGAAARQTLLRLLEPIVYGADLLEGTPVFLAARCLLECKAARGSQEVDRLVHHVVGALQRRSNSAFELDRARRQQATQLLAQLAMPEVAVCLARNTYEKVRMNVAKQWDYEFSSVRFAAAIALKRMAPAEARHALEQISPKLPALFAAWQQQDIDEVIRQSENADDPGLQSLAALALGDLHAALVSEKPPLAAGRALNRLIDMFRSGDTRQNVRWAVADALSLLDSVLIAESLTNPLLRELDGPDRAKLRQLAKIRKTLAYLLGILRQRDERVRNFLVRECLGQEGTAGSRDWSTWATAIATLGRIASEPDRKLIAEIAAGRWNGLPLEQRLGNEAHRNYVRCEAINTLASLGDLSDLSPEDADSLAGDPALSSAYYRATYEVYWRRVAVARAAQ